MAFRIGLRKFGKEREGSAAVEFAFVVPVLLALHLGSQDLALAFAFKHKLDNNVSCLGDLVAQMTEITKASVVDTFNAGAAVLQSYDAKKLGTRISAVTIDSSGKSTVQWSVAQNDALKARQKGSVIDLPSNLTSASEKFIIVTEAVYKYPFIFENFGLKGIVTLKSDSFARTRGSKLPECTDCG